MSKILAVVGMHRTGTSLLARYLTESGVFMGEDLLERHLSNPAGHYEDKEFLALHNDILRAHNLDFKVTSKIPWKTDQEFEERGRTLIAHRETYTMWGWKDPRTCLFFDFWKTLIPGCLYLICYRHYLPVIKSLIQRDMLFYKEDSSRLDRILHSRFSHSVLAASARTYLEMWIYYNSEILSQIEKTGFRYLLVPFDEISKGSFTVLESLSKFGYHLRPPNHFKPQLSRTRKKLGFNIMPDPDLVEIADKIHTRFQLLTKTMLSS